MATDEALRSITRLAGADLSASQYKALDLTNSGGSAVAVVVSSAGARALGILQNKPASGQAATIGFDGVTRARYGGNVVAGNNLQADADGDLIVAASGDYVIGVALESGADGEVHSVLLLHNAILA